MTSRPTSAARPPRHDRTTVALAAGVALALLRSARREGERSQVTPAPAELGSGAGSSYDAQVEAMRALITAHVPTGDTVLVITRGDARLVDLPGRDGRHFPADERGVWAGHHPALGTAAALLESQRGRASHLALPVASAWWLQTYPELVELVERGTLVAHDDAAGWVWRLPAASTPGLAQHGASRSDASGSDRSDRTDAERSYRRSALELTGLLDALGAEGDDAAVVSRGDEAFCATTRVRTQHFPGDRSGRYDGHPRDDADACARLEQLLEEGVRWFVLPADAAWWAEHYPGLWRRLETRHRVVVDRPAVGRIVALQASQENP